MPAQRSLKKACALAIAGLDPGGGAGILADLRAFHAAGAFGCAVVAVTTIQSTAGLASAKAQPAESVVAQAREVLEHQRVRAVKIGALGSAENVTAVARLLRAYPDLPVVVDPVMLPTRGKGRLLADAAIYALREAIIPRATVVTANVAEAQVLTGRAVRTIDDAADAARALVTLGASTALVKGGHLSGKNAVDVFAFGSRIVELSLPRLSVGRLHGTGCVLASLIAGRIARHENGSILSHVRWAKRVHHAAIATARHVGFGARVLWPGSLQE